MTTYYIKRGTALHPSTHTEVLESLPLGTWQVMFNPDMGFYLEEMDDLEANTDKLYGDIVDRAERVMRTSSERGGNTGVLLTGEKGSGKSLLARVICSRARAMGVSTLVVASPYGGELFNQFLESINHPLVILFDEFDKVYEKHEQQAPLLPLFDGVASGGNSRLFLVTLNEILLLSRYLINRPGRFYYHYQFDSLEESFVREYVEDKLENKEMVEKVVIFTKAFHKLNFDMLKALVEEMNRYSEDPNQVIKHLNVTPYGGDGTSNRWRVSDFKLKKPPKGMKVKEARTYSGNINPLENSFYIYFSDDDDESDFEDISVMFNPDDIVSYTSGKLLVANDDAEITLVLKEKHRRLMEF